MPAEYTSARIGTTGGRKFESTRAFQVSVAVAPAGSGWLTVGTQLPIAEDRKPAVPWLAVAEPATYSSEEKVSIVTPVNCPVVWPVSTGTASGPELVSVKVNVTR